MIIPYTIEVLVEDEYRTQDFELEILDYEPPTEAMSDQAPEGAHFSVSAIYFGGEKLTDDVYKKVIDELTPQDYDIIGERIADLIVDSHG